MSIASLTDKDNPNLLRRPNDTVHLEIHQSEASQPVEGAVTHGRFHV